MLVNIKETHINVTEDYLCCEPYKYESNSPTFKELQKEHGRCISKLYTDHSFYGTLHTGWVFQKKIKYCDCNKYYIHETWVELDNLCKYVKD